jgi:hypothetical protein
MDSSPYSSPTESNGRRCTPPHNRIAAPAIVGALTGATLFLVSAVTIGSFFPLADGCIVIGGSAALGGVVPARYLSPLWAAAAAALLTSNSYGDWIIYGIMAGLAAVPAMITQLLTARTAGQQ